jgi:hypothetical protein
MLFHYLPLLLCVPSTFALTSHDLPPYEKVSILDEVDILKHHKAVSHVSLVDSGLEIQLVDGLGNMVDHFSNETQTLTPGESFEDALSYIFGVYKPNIKLYMASAIQFAFYEGLKRVRRSFYAYSNYYFANDSVVISIAYPVGYLKYRKEISEVFQLVGEIKDEYYFLLLQRVSAWAV